MTSVDTLTELLAEVEAWGRATFPASTDHAKITHLREEISELIAEPWSGEESADCLMILAHLLGARGVATLVAAVASRTIEETEHNVRAKLAVCRRRHWGQADANGVVKAIKHTVREYQSGWAVISPEGSVAVGYLPSEGVAKTVALEYDERIANGEKSS